jgi:hypothetical protein
MALVFMVNNAPCTIIHLFTLPIGAGNTFPAGDGFAALLLAFDAIAPAGFVSGDLARVFHSPLWRVDSGQGQGVFDPIAKVEDVFQLIAGHREKRRGKGMCFGEHFAPPSRTTAPAGCQSRQQFAEFAPVYSAKRHEYGSYFNFIILDAVCALQRDSLQ